MSTTLHAQEGAIRRSLVANLDKLELRKAGNGKDYTITGHAAVFNSWSEDLYTPAGVFKERVAPGAFRSVLATNPDVRLLFNHDGMPLARTKSKTLELSEDESGLRVWAKVAPVGTGEQLQVAMERGDVDQMSFAFTVAADEWNDEGEPIERTITQVGELYDVAPVTYPAYPDTDVSARELRRAAREGRIVLPQVVPVPEERMDAEDLSTLAQMLALGTEYLEEQDEAGDQVNVPVMQGALATIAGLIPHEVSEDEANEPEDEENSLKTAEQVADAAQPERDAAGNAESREQIADGDQHSSAPAETDPVVGEAEVLAQMQRDVRAAALEERENVLRLLKETRDGPH